MLTTQCHCCSLSDVTTTVKIPDTVDLLKDVLSDLSGLASATGWQLAALVWAWVTPGFGGPRPTARKVVQFSTREFAELGIRGLKTQDSVRKYRTAWQQAIDAGLATSVQPGEETELPSVDFGEFVNLQRDPPLTAREHPHPRTAPPREHAPPGDTYPRPDPHEVQHRSHAAEQNALRRNVSDDIALPVDLQSRALEKYAERALDAAESTPGEIGIQATRLVGDLIDVVLGVNPKHSYLRCFDAVVEILAAVKDN